MAKMATVKQLKSQGWRLNNLYYIKDKQGKKVKFKLNWAQKILYSDMWYLNIILKARQLGMTTFIQIYMLDVCLFNSNISAGVVAHNRDDAQKFFKDKIKFAYDNLPTEIKQVRKSFNDNAGELTFSNGSTIRVGTSLRSGTYQYLHISEFGKICARYPDKAEEIITGSLETVAKGQFVYIESTAEGDYGRFYDMCMEFMHAANLTSMDYKFFFFPWYDHPEYTLDSDVETPVDTEAYFEDLQHKQGIELSKNQRAWYVKKKAVQKGKMKQEYPSTPEEAFEQISEFAVYGEEIQKVMLEHRLTALPVTANKPVDLFLDIGKSAKAETTCAWFMQNNDPWYDFVDFYQNSLRPVGVYVKEIKEKGYNIGRWFIPHDADSQKDYDIKTFKDRLIGAGVNKDDIVVVPRVDLVKTGVDMMKEIFPACRFDKNNVVKGWRAVKAYMYDYNEKRGVIGQPIHNWASHPADAIRQFAQGYSIETEYKPIKLKRKGWG
jgi:hypothetical protein